MCRPMGYQYDGNLDLDQAIAGWTSLSSCGAKAPSLGDRPLVVLTAMIGQPASQLRMMGLTAAQGDGVQAATRVLHEEQAGWSSHGRHELVAGASHYIHFDRPEVVTAAVREVVDGVPLRS